MKRTLSLIVLLTLCIVSWAVPSQRVRRSVLLADGTHVYVTLMGDEHFSWLQTDDGFVVEPTADGSSYVLTDRTATEVYDSFVQANESQFRAPRRIGSAQTAPLPTKGTVKVPVVLVNFADSVFHVADTDEGVRNFYDLYCNGTRDGKLYKEHRSYGSIRDYFVQQSDSLFLPEFVILGPVTLSHPEGYYGGNKTGSKDTMYSAFRSESIKLVTEQNNIDWSVFDNKGKGQVDLVFFIFAGCGEANGGPSNSLWPKENTGNITANGIKFATSACCNENRATSFDNDGNVTSARADGIGIMCHELCHALGLPDFYDTRSNPTYFGMDLWSVMDYGCYGRTGYQPVAFTAYERDFMGWRMLDSLTENQHVTLIPMEKGGIGYKIINDENPKEYYVVENRQNVGWDSGLYVRTSATETAYFHGMQVTHVDFDAGIWNGNSVNSRSDHQRMTIIAANNLYKGTTANATNAELTETWSGNLWPFGANDSLTSNSVPAATVYSASGFMKHDINAITELDNGNITFYFGNDFATGIQGTSSFVNRSSSVAYDLQGRQMVNGNLPKGLYIRDGRKLIIR